MILDKGYVRLVNVMGSDVDVVNAARASFNREVDTIGENDIKLINYLVYDVSAHPHSAGKDGECCRRRD